MSQVVSRNRRSGEYELSNHHHNRNQHNHLGQPPPWKRPMLIAFHGASACTYGFAICWQNVSAASAQLYLRTNPTMRIYGKWRFLTYNCLVMQFVAYSLCLASHFVPRLRRPRDFFFTTFAFPVGMLVVSSFWSIWFVAGREYIFPAALESFYPPWLNHITHTIIAPINLAELVLVRHQYSSDRKAITPLTGYILSYTAYLLYIRFQTGRFVYPFLNKMDTVPVGAFITGMAVFVIVVYKSGKFIHDFIHGIKSIKGNNSTKRSKKN